MFRYFLEVYPQQWPKLAHTCRKWRRIVLASHKALQLRLFCTYGTPVQKTLDCWPATMHIVLEYGGSTELVPPAPEDDDNIMTALKQSNRVTSISLTITRSLRGKLFAIERPFSNLEHLVLLSRDMERLMLPNTFRWGSRLRSLHLTRIRVPQPLFASRNLVDIRLHKISDSWLCQPEALADALSGMTQLRSLTLNLLSTHYLSELLRFRDRVFLPALTHIKFQGYTKYLERLVARIDTPCLREIEVTFLHESNYDLPKLRGFTNRIGGYKSPCRADILSSLNAISISLTSPGYLTRLTIQSMSKPLSEQLLFVARICNQLATVLSNVEDLHISTKRPWRQEDASYSEQWSELINPFIGVKRVHIDSNLLIDDFLRTLQLSYTRRETLLPALDKLCILQHRSRHAPLREAVVSFMTSCRLSGHPIAVEYEQAFHINKLGDAGTTHASYTATTR
jgi:hypothetical protein